MLGATLPVRSAAAAALLASWLPAQSVLLQDGQAVGGVGNVSAIHQFAVVDGGSWVAEVDTDAADALDVVMLRDGVVVAQEGQALQPPGATLSSFDAISLDTAGNSAWNFFLDGVDDDSGVYWNTTLVLGEGQVSTAAAFTTGTTYLGFFDSRINEPGDVLVVASVADAALPTIVDRALVLCDLDAAGALLAETVAAKEGDAPAGLGGDTILDFGTGAHEYDFNDLGQTAYFANVTTTAGGGEAILIDGTLVARSGAPSPAAGRNWESLTGRPLALNDAGDLLFRADIDGSTADDERLWLRTAGGTFVQVAAEGDAVTTSSGTFLITSFGSAAPVALSSSSDPFFFADLDDPDTTRDEVLIHAGNVLVQEGHTQLGGPPIEGLVDTAGQLAMSPDGQWFLFGCELAGGAYAVGMITTADLGPFCSGIDGSHAACPCGNAGAPLAGCDNAQSTGGVELQVAGQTTSPNGATLVGTGFTAMGAPTAVLIRSTGLDPARPVVFGDGLRCVASTPLVRLAATVALSGTSTHVFGHAAMAGSGFFYYQIWYRSTPSTFCDPLAAFNLSSGERLLW